MKRVCGFSLAEALITLLVICIIAMATAPIITKKKRAPQTGSATTVWTTDRETASTIYPAASRDIKLGEINDKKAQGIIVVGTLEFKDRDGRTIGWIKENGENSFNNTEEIVAKQQEIIEILTTLTNDLKSALNNSSSNNYGGNYGGDYDYTSDESSSGSHQVNGGITGRERLERRGSFGSRTNKRSSASGGVDISINADQITRIAQLQKEIDALMSPNR